MSANLLKSGPKHSQVSEVVQKLTHIQLEKVCYTFCPESRPMNTREAIGLGFAMSQRASRSVRHAYEVRQETTGYNYWFVGTADEIIQKLEKVASDNSQRY